VALHKYSLVTLFPSLWPKRYQNVDPCDLKKLWILEHLQHKGTCILCFGQVKRYGCTLITPITHLRIAQTYLGCHFSKYMTKTAPKWGSVRPRKMVHNWSFWAQWHMHFMLEARKRPTLSFNDLNEPSSHCTNISGAPFGPDLRPNGTKMRIRATSKNGA
jgi:hypothetical protein